MVSKEMNVKVQTLAVLETCYASWAVIERKHHMQIQKWELSMVLNPKSRSLVAAGRSSTRKTAGDVLARSTPESNAGVNTFTEWNGCVNEQTSKLSEESFFDTVTRTATFSWSTP